MWATTAQVGAPQPRLSAATANPQAKESVTGAQRATSAPEAQLIASRALQVELAPNLVLARQIMYALLGITALPRRTPPPQPMMPQLMMVVKEATAAGQGTTA